MSAKPLMINAFDPAAASGLANADRELVERRARLLGPAYRLFYQEPVHFVRGEGVWLYDADGARYLDVYNNVASVGHCHPKVVEAVARQSAILNTHTRYLHPAVLDYSEMLLATVPGEPRQVMYTCTGSEANDLAIRVAKSFTGGTGIIVTALAYHGVTETVAGLSPSLGAGVPLGPGVYTVPAPRSESAGDVAETFAEGVRSALRQMALDGVRPAALLVDTIFSSDGVFAEPAGFLEPAVAAMREAGGVFIADEVQAGFARTGDAMWGFQRHRLDPDLITMGKPMGNGYPVAAMVAKPHILAPFGARARYFNTFGGNPVAMEAARAVLEIIQADALQENARLTGQYLREGLRLLSDRHDAIGDIRGAGLFIGVELFSDRSARIPDPVLTARIVNDLRRRHVLISASGPHANVLKIRPPLPFGIEESDIFLAALGASLNSLTAGRSP